jgi:hypothetical protein
MPDVTAVDDELPVEALLLEDQAAAIAGVTLNAMRQMRVRGDGPAFVIVGRTRIRYEPSAVRAWLKTRTFNSMADYYAKDSARARTAELQRQAAKKVRRARWKRKPEAAAENASK